MNKVYIGIDNGVTGTIGIVSEEFLFFEETPVKIEQSYTKKRQNITRISVHLFKTLLSSYIDNRNSLCIIERPMVNPTRFKATLSAMRCLEATLVCLEDLFIPYMYVDSKEWQKEMLNNPDKKSDLKKLSCDYGIRLFPIYKDLISKHKDADGLLIAEWARRKNL